MNLKYHFLNYPIIRHITIAFICFLFTLLIRFSSHAFYGFSIQTVFPIKISQNEWQIDIDPLPKGQYYIPLGRIWGICNIRQNGSIIATNKGITNELKGTLTLGGAFEKTHLLSHQTINLDCLPAVGFPKPIPHKILIFPYQIGLALQLWRQFNELYLGPSLCLLILLMTPFKTSIVTSLTFFSLGRYFTIFNIVLLSYTISLTTFPRLFLNGQICFLLHSCLRVLVSWSFFRLCSEYSRRRYSVEFFHFGILLLLFFYLPIKQNIQFEPFFEVLTFMPLIMIISISDLIKRPSTSLFSTYLRVICLTWIIISVVDIYFGLNKHYGSFPVPALATLIAFTIQLGRNEAIKRSEKEKKQRLDLLQSEANLVSLAAQIAHDLQSPIAALTSLTEQQNELSRSTRSLLNMISLRISGISENLLRFYRNVPTKVNFSKESIDKILINSLISDILSEKRLQYYNNQEITMSFNSECHFFAFANEIELKRIFSNIIDNSVEAFPSHCGQIDVELSSEPDHVVIQFKDNGIGIPNSVLSKISKKKASFGKINGNGLGLYHARTELEKWHGKLMIKSNEGKGTQINIYLCKEDPS